MYSSIRLNLKRSDHIHDNPGTHLTLGKSDDATWLRRWLKVVNVKARRYLVPRNTVGKEFLLKLTAELEGVWHRNHNAEQPLVFVALMLQEADGVRKARDIRDLLRSRLAHWTDGKFVPLMDDFLAQARLRDGPIAEKTDKEAFRAFHAKLTSGRVRAACRNLTNRDGGGLLHPTDKCTKTGRPVLDVLKSKHPPLRDPTELGSEDGVFEPYPALPKAMPLCITQDVVETVASKLSGAAGPGGTDGEELKSWLLWYGSHSQSLRDEFAIFTNWLANDHPPWAAYRAFMACRLVALDKQPASHKGTVSRPGGMVICQPVCEDSEFIT